MADGRSPVSPDVVKQMASSMLHRGPDSEGIWVNGPVGLGHRRLSVIDLSDKARQPMVSEDGRYVLVYNGEIYNFRDLRTELDARGVPCSSQSDTEVLLRLFVQDGLSVVKRLNGIFAFAIWDTHTRQLVAARDPMGVKPFYYSLLPDRLIFASEIKALMYGGMRAEPNLEQMTEYIEFGSVAGTNTLFRSVQRLGAGATLTYRPGHGVIVQHYTSMGSVDRYNGQTGSESTEVRTAIETAVVRQLVSDVPVGAMCSGGLDSSVLSALSTRYTAGINTYCVKIAGEGFDETEFAREVSRHCGSTHFETPSTGREVARLLPTMVWLHDEPLMHSNSIAIFQIARLARKHVTVLLSGEGADEVFGGYTIHRRIRAISMARRWVPRPLANVAGSLAHSIGKPGIAAAFRRLEACDRNNVLISMRSLGERKRIHALMPKLSFGIDARQDFAEAALEISGGDAVQATLLYDQRVYLPTLLDRQDKMCMGTSIESRVPFLDLDLVSLANSLPSGVKIRGRVGKVVLRNAAAGLLPETIVHRRKHAFGVPLRAWLQSGQEFDPLLRRLDRGALVEAGIVDARELRRLIDDALRGDPTVTYIAWHMINLEVWWNVFFQGVTVPDRSELPAYSGMRVMV